MKMCTVAMYTDTQLYASHATQTNKQTNEMNVCYNVYKFAVPVICQRHKVAPAKDDEGFFFNLLAHHIEQSKRMSSIHTILYSDYENSQ